MIKGKRAIRFSTVVAGSLGALSSVVISVILLLIGTSLISADHMQIIAGNYYVVGVQSIAGLAGCFAGGKLAGEKTGIACCIAGGGYLILLTIIALLFFNGLDSTYLWGMLAIGIGCAGGIIVSSKNMNRKRKKRKHFR